MFVARLMGDVSPKGKFAIAMSAFLIVMIGFSWLCWKWPMYTPWFVLGAGLAIFVSSFTSELRLRRSFAPEEVDLWYARGVLRISLPCFWAGFAAIFLAAILGQAYWSSFFWAALPFGWMMFWKPGAKVKSIRW